MKKENIVLLIVLIIGFLLRLRGFALNPSLWHDETSLAWNILNKNYLELFGTLSFLQIAPPLFLICTKFIVTITNCSDNVLRYDMFLKIIPFICGNLALIMMWLVSKKIFNSTWSAIAAVALFATNSVLIDYSFEFKPYIVDVLLTLVSIYIFLKIDFETIKIKNLILYGLIISILPWFSIGSYFTILAGFAVLGFRIKHSPKFAIFIMPFLISTIIYLNTFIFDTYIANAEGMLNYCDYFFVKKDFSNLFTF